MASTPSEDAGSAGVDSESNSGSLAPNQVSSEEPVEAVLERLPPEQRRAIVQVVQQQMSHSGPLPPPEQLRDYDDVLPGLAERIMALTEREQQHRHSIVDLAVSREARLRDRGQILAMVALILMLSFCALLAVLGHAAIAGPVAVAIVVGVVSIFVTGRRADAKENEQQAAEEDKAAGEE